MSAPQKRKTSVNDLACESPLLILNLPKIGLLYWFAIISYFA
jgi:hypothetical protein